MAFLGTVISLPIPRGSFLLHVGSKQYRPHPPALPTIVENIIPTSNIKSHFSRGLQSASALVQHCTALNLGKCLAKFGLVIASMREAQEALEEDEEDGLWSSRRREAEREVLRRVPDHQVIVAFAQQKATEAEQKMQPPTESPNSTKSVLLAESAQRLLWLYQRHFPQLAGEARFDVSKSLAGVQERETERSMVTGFNTLRQLHTLRLLHENEEFHLTGKTGKIGGDNL